MKHDEIKWVGGKAYAICYVCEKIIQVNKQFFGSLHFCDAERAKELGIKL